MVERQTWVGMEVGEDFHSVSQPDDCLEDYKVTAGGGVHGVWLCFICCPLQGGFNLQPTHESAKLKLPFLNLNPKTLVNLGLGRPSALSVGQVNQQLNTSGSDTLGFGSDRTLSNEEEDRKAQRCHDDHSPELLDGRGLLTAGHITCPPS